MNYTNFNPTNFIKMYPRNNIRNCGCHGPAKDERFGGFLLPFLTGAVVSAPFWFFAGNNKYQNQYYQPYPPINYSPYSYYPYYR